MKRITFVLLLSLASVWSLFAGPIHPDQAARIASHLFERIGSSSTKKAFPLADVRLDRTVYLDADIQPRGFGHTGQSSRPCFYVFNRGEKAGFAIIAADDLLPEIIAYSDTGEVDMDQLPPNLAFFLRIYKEEIRTVLASSRNVSGYTSYNFPDLPQSVAPLMESGKWKTDHILWDQLSPFNKKLPTGAKYTGCVATATAQIMRYHSWPEKGTGSNSYYDGGLKVNHSITLGEKYDWDNMPGKLEGALSETQKDALATLMRDVSLSINTYFYRDVSIAYSSPVVRALRNNFGYKKSLRMVDRLSTTAYEWQKMIRTELSKNRPVYYAGADETVGHAFVCDGYKEDGTYHFNWGWSGDSNGFYRLTLLAPTSLGSGAGNGSYTITQEIIIGIEPEDGTVSSQLAECDFRLYQSHFPQVYNTQIGGSATLFCINEVDPVIFFGVRVTNPDGRVTEVKASDYTYQFPLNYYKTIQYRFDRSLLKAGRNKVEFITRRSNAADPKWNPVLSYAGVQHPWYYVVVEGDKAEIEMVEKDLHSVSIEKVDARLLSYKQSEIDIHYLNKGIDERRERLYLKLKPKRQGEGLRDVSIEPIFVEIAPNSQKTVIHVDIPDLKALPGEYLLEGQFSSDDEWTTYATVFVQNGWAEAMTAPGRTDLQLCYPNPTTDYVALLNPTPEHPVDYAIYAMNGRLWLRGEIQGEQTNVDLSALPAGTYLVRVGARATQVVRR